MEDDDVLLSVHVPSERACRVQEAVGLASVEEKALRAKFGCNPAIVC